MKTILFLLPQQRSLANSHLTSDEEEIIFILLMVNSFYIEWRFAESEKEVKKGERKKSIDNLSRLHLRIVSKMKMKKERSRRRKKTKKKITVEGEMEKIEFVHNFLSFLERLDYIFKYARKKIGTHLFSPVVIVLELFSFSQI